MHDFTCELDRFGQPMKDGSIPCGFESTGWPTKADRDARAKQHATEHETEQPMPELADFTREG